MHPILMKVTRFLTTSLRQPMYVEDRLIEEFGEKCKKLLRRHFNEKRSDKFTLRMSNIGKPTCQLQMEAMGAPKEPQPYNLKMKFIYGDMIEALAVFVMKAAGVNVQAEQMPVDLEIGGTVIDGTADIEIDDAIYDVKSVSKWAFKHKFGPDGGFNKIAQDDTFGYLGQGFAYGKGAEKPFAGWISVGKEDGQWSVVEVPDDALGNADEAIAKVDNSVRRVISKAEFRRNYQDIPELFRRKATGNKVLSTVCSFCEYKRACWPGLEHRAAIVSEASNPVWKYYTHIDPNWKEILKQDVD